MRSPFAKRRHCPRFSSTRMASPPWSPAFRPITSARDRTTLGQTIVSLGRPARAVLIEAEAHLRVFALDRRRAFEPAARAYDPMTVLYTGTHHNDIEWAPIRA